MGKRGPAPKPTAILKLHGSHRAKSREAKGEMKPEAGRPVDPKHRNESDKKAWTQLVDRLESIPGLLTIIDGLQLERYARFLVRWREIEDHLETVRDSTLLMLSEKDDRQTLRLLWNESRSLDLHLKQIEEKFGLTPSARTRIQITNNSDSTGKLGDKSKSRFFGKQA